MAKIKKIQESGTTIYPATITNAVKDPETGKTLPEILKEREEDTYPKMSVGFAENIVGDKSTTEEEFSFRPTAGVNRNTLNDGAARIHSIKGRSVVANQLLSHRTETFERYGIIMTQDGSGWITVKGTATSDFTRHLGNAQIIKGNHYYLYGVPKNGSLETYYLSDQAFMQDLGDGIINVPNYSDNRAFVLKVMSGTTVDFKFFPKVINLTQEFGAGNEPTTVEEYYQRKPILLNEDEYNTGKLVNLVPKAIKTTGLNQFNGTYAKVLGGVQYYLGGNYTSIGFATEEGGTTEAITTPTSSEVAGGSAPADRLYTPSQNGYIYANGGSICISLYWPTEYGNLYGTYQPYRPFVRDLSWIKTIKDSTGNAIFPNGMRSAGNVADEIRFNSTEQRWEAVQRVGVVDLGDLTWTGTQNLYYAAAIPTIAQAINRLDGLMCSRYPVSTYTGINENAIDKTILRYEKQIVIKDTSYQNPTEFKASLQGVMLNYELADDYVAIQDIEENINFDYDISDYGTEELIVAEGVESAPLSASIEYSPNVLAMLKNAPDIADDVDALKSQVAALTAQLVELMATNNE